MSREEEERFDDEDDDLEDELDDDVRKRDKGIEGLLRDWSRKAIEKGIEKGIGTLKTANTALHDVASEVKLPREVTSYVYTQIDETKNVIIRAVAQEVRAFLENTDVATELQRALTAISFEIKTEIRFIPNEAGKLEPRMKAKVRPKKADKAGRANDEKAPVAEPEASPSRATTPPAPPTITHIDPEDEE